MTAPAPPRQARAGQTEAENHGLVLRDAALDRAAAGVVASSFGCADDPATELGPLVTAEHKCFASGWTDRAGEEGAELVLDGRDVTLPVSFFPFSGHTRSFFGDAHVLGADGLRFSTETKCVTSRRFTAEDRRATRVGTWEGAVSRI